jgi:hypothetical protein
VYDHFVQPYQPTASRLRLAWIADVLGGAFCGSMLFGALGAVAGATFMATAGGIYRRQRLRRAAQLRELRERHSSARQCIGA